MTQLLVLICLVLTGTYVSVAMANERDESQNIVDSTSPASSPSNCQNPHKAESPNVRKIGKPKIMSKEYSSKAPALSPTRNTISTSTEHLKHVTEEDVDIQIHQKKPHHSIDKSVAGGGVILGGLATTFLVSVFCYIKATGKHKTESPATSAPSSPSSSVNV